MEWVSIETAFIFILLVLLIQSIGIAVALRSFGAKLSALDRGSQALSDQAAKALAKLRTALDETTPVTEKIPDWCVDIERLSTAAAERARRGNQAAEGTLRAVHSNLLKAEKHIDQGLQDFTRYSYQVHRAVVDPSRKISRVLSAAAGAVRGLIRRPNSPEFVSDDPDFI